MKIERLKWIALRGGVLHGVICRMVQLTANLPMFVQSLRALN